MSKTEKKFLVFTWKRACGLEGSIRWDKKEIVIKDKNRSYKDLSFNFCKECGDVTNYMMLRGDRQ